MLFWEHTEVTQQESQTGPCYISITLQKEPHAEELGYVR